MTTQERMKDRLQRLGIGYREVQVYGSQIVITCISHDTAERWAMTLARFAKVRGIVKSIDYHQSPTRGTVLSPQVIPVFRVFATI